MEVDLRGEESAEVLIEDIATGPVETTRRKQPPQKRASRNNIGESLPRELICSQFKS